MPRKPHSLPIVSEHLIRHNAELWLTSLKYRESMTIIEFQDNSEYRVPEVIKNKHLLREFLGRYNKRYLLAHVLVDDSGLIESLKKELIKLCHEKKVGIESVSNQTEIEEILDLLEAKGLEVGLFVSKVLELLDQGNFSEFKHLQKLLTTYRFFSVILFSERDVTATQYSRLVDTCSKLFQKIHYTSLYPQEESLLFIEHYLQLWDLDLGTDKVKTLLDNTGGYYWLITHLLRYMRDNKGASLTTALEDPLLLNKLEVIWQRFSENERIILRRIVHGSLSRIERESHEFAYLRQIGMVIEENNTVRLGVPLLRLSVEKESKSRELEVVGKKFLFQGKDITIHFSPSEKQLLAAVLSSKGVLVTRKKLAAAVWGKQKEAKFSDWALDRLLSRLRKKLELLGVGSSLLITKKGLGVVYG